MKFTTQILGAAVLSAFAAASFATEMPTENKGLSPTPLQTQPLAQQIPAMAGYVMRSRIVSLEPGGSVQEHSHADRPGFLYVLEGELTEYRGETVRVMRPGDSLTEAFDTVHGVKNETDQPVVVVVVDLIKEE